MPRPAVLLLPLALTLLTALPGCAVHTPAGSVIIDPPPASRPAGGQSQGNSTFCPPGQAKKGNC
jgi:hypothetical protein